MKTLTAGEWDAKQDEIAALLPEHAKDGFALNDVMEKEYGPRPDDAPSECVCRSFLTQIKELRTENAELRAELDALKREKQASIEAAAKRIHAVMVALDTTGEARAWQGGNSHMEDLARRYAAVTTPDGAR